MKRFVRLEGKKGTGFESLLPPAEEEKVATQHQGEYVLETCEPGLFVLLSILTKSRTE